ncbi:MAG: response regulator [Deltaproteobacteria bacterium]|nr:response regulator [Deltaproteobacteria bacterium]
MLVVEDSPGDRKLVSHLFRECTPPCQLFFAADGEEATEFIFKRGQFETAVTPDLVILDLNMPNKDGRDVLKEIKTTPNLKRIPVVVLTTSSSHQDVDAAYEFQANSYIQKPSDLSQFRAVIDVICQYWLRTVELPTTL